MELSFLRFLDPNLIIGIGTAIFLFLLAIFSAVLREIMCEKLRKEEKKIEFLKTENYEINYF